MRDRRPTRVKILKIPSIVIDRHGRHLRAAQVRTIIGGVATIRLHREHHIIVDRTCDVGLLQPGQAVGQCCVVEVADPEGACAIVAVHAAAPADFAAEAAYDADGVTFAPGMIPKELGGNDE